MSEIYPIFAATCIASVIGESIARDAPELYFYALSNVYEFDVAHVNLDDVDPAAILGKSIALSGTIGDNATLSISETVDAFSSNPLDGVASMILVAEWVDDSLLILFQDAWVNTGVPFVAPTKIRISYVDDFVLRLGNIGPEA